MMETLGLQSIVNSVLVVLDSWNPNNVNNDKNEYETDVGKFYTLHIL